MSSENTDPVNSPSSALVSTTGTPSPDPAELSIKLRRRPIPRKGHTKSRRGCFNCKRRKVKCQESRPVCSNCTRVGLDCEYPDSRPRQWQDPLAVVVSSSRSVIPSPSTPLQSTATIFTPDDMRFFHHFLVSAYPALPIQGDEMWKNVAPLAHSYDYLMHAMLGLAASHLDIYGANVASHALSHRVKAIKLLNQALSTPPKSTPEADARYAAIFTLAFQASCMPEGMSEFMAMIKGSHVIAQTFLPKHPDSLFRSFTQVGYGESVRRILGTAPFVLEPKEEEILSSALESVRALGPLCTSSLEVKFLASTERVINIARISATEAFALFSEHYGLVLRAAPEEFAPFVDSNHYPAQLLLIHFMLIEFVIGYVALGEMGRRFAYREKSMIAWVKQVDANLPEKYKKFAEWPMHYAQTELIR